MKPELTALLLLEEAKKFAELESDYSEPSLYGVTDGKAVGTYLEHKFVAHLVDAYSFQLGNSALGIDFPGLYIDMKVTSLKQPQSSCPFRSASQKVYGLGYNLLVFVYIKTDDNQLRTGKLDIQHTIYVDQSRTGDFQTTRGILDILAREGNEEDLLAFFQERNLPLDDIGAQELASRIIENPPQEGYLTISNALQWRLQYGRVIKKADEIVGIQRIG